MDPQGQPKFVQITTTVAPLSPTLLYALDSAGTVWLFNFSKKKWGRLATDRELGRPRRVMAIKPKHVLLAVGLAFVIIGHLGTAPRPGRWPSGSASC